MSHIAGNGAVAIHDFEFAMLGATSESVAEGIDNGTFGMWEETGRWMQEARVLVLPSTEEGMGVVLLEAMACGTPVIGSDVGGIPEVVGKGDCAVLVEPENVRLAKLARKRRRRQRYAVRRPKDYKVEAPGDLVQVDTLHARLVPDERRFQFRAHDVISKRAALRVYKRQTSGAAAEFLYHLKMKFPFHIRAIQIDGGSEFMDEFEKACKRSKIRLFVNPPHHPEMNGGVERGNRTDREEFYEVEDLSLDLQDLNLQVEEYERKFNYVRPHKALVMRTPNEYYLLWKKNQNTQVSPMS